MKPIWLLACLLTMQGHAFAQSPPAALVCAMRPASTGVLQNHGAYKASSSNEEFNLTFAAINLKTGRAQLIGNIGVSEVFVGQGTSALHFDEITAAGNRMLTTVLMENGQELSAVHSRHTVIANSISVSQYVGKCVRRD